MPNITQYDPGNIAIRPSETGVESLAGAGRRIGVYGNQIAGALKQTGAEVGSALAHAGDTAVAYMDHQQINAGADHSTRAYAALTEDMNKTFAQADVHDPSVAQKWMDEKFQSWADQFLQGFSTEKSQNWANERVNQMRQHFFVQGEAQMSSMAKESATATYHNNVTSLSNAAVQNPAGLDDHLAMLKNSVDAVIAANPNIKGSDAAELRTKLLDDGSRTIAQAAAVSAVMNSGNPVAAAAAMSRKYPDLISGAESLKLAKAAEVQEKANISYSKSIQLQNRQLAEAKAADIHAQADLNLTTTDPVKGTTTVDPQYYQEAKKVLQTGAPNAAQTYQGMINWADAKRREAEGEKVTTDPAVYSQLSAAVQSGDPNAENAIRKAEAEFKLDTKQASLLINWNKSQREVANDPIFKYQTDAAKQIIEGTTAGEKSISVGKFPAFMAAFTAEYLRLRNSGQLPPNALDLSDDKSLIRQMMTPYDINQNMGQFIQMNGGVAAPTTTPAQSAPKTIPPGTPMATM